MPTLPHHPTLCYTVASTQLNSTVSHSTDDKEPNRRSHLLVEVEVEVVMELRSDGAVCLLKKCCVVVTVNKRLFQSAAFTAECCRLHQHVRRIELMLRYSIV